MSTGGDEFNEECYVQDPQTQADLQASGQTLEQALGTFVRTMQGVLQKEGKTPVVWEGEFDTYMHETHVEIDALKQQQLRNCHKNMLNCNT